MKIHTHYTDKNGKEKPLIQGTDEWLDVRAGRPTASRYKDIFTVTGKPSPKYGILAAAHVGYMCELVQESIFPTYATGDEFISEAMAHGILFEPEARKFYEKLTGHDVQEVGFCTMDTGICGMSPDGLVQATMGDDPDWGLEIKCPQPKTHIRWVYDGKLPDAHKQQVHGCMVVSGLDRWDFLSYHPDMGHLLVEVHRDEYTEKLAAALEEFTVKYAEFREKILPKLKTS